MGEMKKVIAWILQDKRKVQKNILAQPEQHLAN